MCGCIGPSGVIDSLLLVQRAEDVARKHVVFPVKRCVRCLVARRRGLVIICRGAERREEEMGTFADTLNAGGTPPPWALNVGSDV